MTFSSRPRHIRTKIRDRLVAELEGGASFRNARRRAGVSWWGVFICCLRGRRRFHNSPFSPQDSQTAFLLALADVRHRKNCDLGLIVNWLVSPYQPQPSEVSRHHA